MGFQRSLCTCVVIFLASYTGLVFSLQPTLREDSCSDLRQAKSQETRHFTVKHGSPLLLNCSFDLNLPLFITNRNVAWIKNGQPFMTNDIFGRSILYSNGSLFTPVAKSKWSSRDGVSDDGVYFCIFNSTLQTIFSSPIKVTVAVLGRIADQQDSVAIPAGSFHQLPCSIDKAMPKPIITWFKDNVAILNTSIYSGDGQFSRSGQLMDQAPVARHSNLSAAILPDGVLELGPVSALEAGKYYCTASNFMKSRKGNEIRLNVSPGVRVSKAVQLKVKPDKFSAHLGSISYLSCFATGYPTPTVTWQKNGKPIDFKSETRLRLVGIGGLLIVQTNTADAGRYTCSADNGASTAQSASAKITVLVPPSITAQPPCTSLTTAGQTARLNCNVSAFPAPATIWYRHGRLVQPSRRISIGDNELVLNAVSPKDAGVYHCVATNSEGAVVIAQRLKVYTPTPAIKPRPSKVHSLMEDLMPSLKNAYQLSLRDLTPSSVLVSWTRHSTLVLPPVDYRVKIMDKITQKNRTIPTSEQMLRINDLVPGHEMVLTVMPTRRFNDKPLPELHFVMPMLDNSAGRIKNFGASSPSSTEIFVSWDQPSSERLPHSYCVHIQDMDNSPTSYMERNFTHTSNTVSGLLKFTMYGIKVAPVSRHGQVGLYSPLIRLKTMGDVPDQPPFNVSINSEGVDRVQVRWSAPPLPSINGNLRGYKIKYKPRNSKGFTENAPADASQFMLKGLKKNTEYTLKMQVVNEFGVGPSSKKLSFVTPKRWIPETRAPAKPQLLDTQRFSTSITVLWEPPEGDIFVRSYEIGWGERAPKEHTDTVNSKQLYYNIEKLKPSTRYFITVRASNNAGQGLEALINAKTKAKDVVGELYPPLGVHISVLTPTTINVSWHDTPKGKDSYYYVVRYKTNVPMEPRVQEVNSTDMHCIIHRLRPHTYYEIAVKVIQQDRKSPWSMSVNAVTKESPPSSAPLDITVTPMDDDTTAAQINWQPPEEPNGVLDGYLIFYTTDPNRAMGNWVIEPVVGDKLSHEITGLTRDTLYYFKALARNSVGTGPYSKMVEYRTASGEAVDVTNSWDMPAWMWYVIIGGVTLLVLCTAIIATLVMCRNRRMSKPRKPSRHDSFKSSNGRLPPTPGHKAMEASQLRAPSLTSDSWLNTANSRLLAEGGDGRYHHHPLHHSTAAPYLYSGAYNQYGGQIPEMLPLNGPQQADPSVFMGSYRFQAYPSSGVDVFSNAGKRSVDLQSHYSDVGSGGHTDDGHGTRHDSFNRNPHRTTDGRYSPTHGLTQLGERHCDSAYGSDHPLFPAEPTSPRATIQHGQSYAKNRQLPNALHTRGKTSSLGSSESGQGAEIADSAVDSRSESLSTDDMNADMANAINFVNDMKAAQY